MKHFLNQKKINTVSFIYVILGLFALNVGGNGIFMLFLGLIFLVLIKSRTAFKFSLDFWLLCAFACSYFAFTGFSNAEMSFGEISRGIAIPIAFFIGLNISNKTEISSIKKIIYILSICMALHGVLNLLYNFNRIGFEIINNVTSLYDVWSGTFSSATGQSANFVLLAGILYYGLFVQPSKLKRIGILILLLLASFYNIALGGRSFLVLIFLSTVSGFLLHGYYSFKKRNFIKNITPALIFIGVFTICTFYFYQYNVGGIRYAIENSYLYHRFFSISGQELTEDGRIVRKIQYLSLFFTYIFGGNHIRIDHGVGFAHDLWLDIYDAAGIVPFTLILIYSLRAWNRIYLLLKSKNIKVEEKVLFGSFSLVISIFFFIEPIFFGAPLVFLSFCIIDGMVAKHILRNKT